MYVEYLFFIMSTFRTALGVEHAGLYAYDCLYFYRLFYQKNPLKMWKNQKNPYFDYYLAKSIDNFGRVM